MRFFFHAMLGFSVGIVVTGMTYGALARERGPQGASAHPGLHRVPQEHVSLQAAIAPPLPLLPRYGDAVAAGSTLMWHLLDGTDGARVELSRAPTFEKGETRHFEVDGERLRLPDGWPAGVWYWRVRGRSGSVIGDRSTPTWMMVVTQPQQGDWG
jgi:hypothetical protein